jgi:DNA-binding transcriptional regulator YiaG
MANIASVLKTEITRLARKELRFASGSTKKAIASYRREIAALKRRMQSLERELMQLRKQAGRSAPADRVPDESPSVRFRAEGFAQHRKRLGLSARQAGLLLDASSLSVYKWEKGQATPRAKHLEAIANLRKMGKREAQRRLEALSAAS